MTIKTLTLLSSALIAAAAFPGPAKSEELAPYAGQTIALGDMRGTVYYATNGADFVVVATLDSDGRPMRFVATLQPGQSTKISTPGAVNQPEKAIEFMRDGDRLLLVDHSRPSRIGALASDGQGSESR